MGDPAAFPACSREAVPNAQALQTIPWSNAQVRSPEGRSNDGSFLVFYQ